MAYRFDDFKWLGNMAGFGVPTDVYYGSVYLGLIESKPDGYVIQMVDTPKGKQRIKQGGQNLFKTKEHAAEILHKSWKILRGGQIQDKEGEEWKLTESTTIDEMSIQLMSNSGVYRKHYKKLADKRDEALKKIQDEMTAELKNNKSPLGMGDWKDNVINQKFQEKRNQILIWFADSVDVLDKSFERYFKPEDSLVSDIPYRNLQKSDDETGKDLDIPFPQFPGARPRSKSQPPKNNWDKFMKAVKKRIKVGKLSPNKAKQIVKKRWKRFQKMFKESSE